MDNSTPKSSDSSSIFIRLKIVTSFKKQTKDINDINHADHKRQVFQLGKSDLLRPLNTPRPQCESLTLLLPVANTAIPVAAMAPCAMII